MSTLSSLLRDKKGLMQEELSEKIGIRRPMLAQIEREMKTITLPLGKQIADVFGCTMDDLIKE